MTKQVPYRRTAFFLASLFLLAMFFKNSAIAANAIAEGIRLCARTLIPSLFPLMVASELLCSCGAVDRLAGILRRPFGCLFGLSGNTASAVLLGAAFGFPIGTRRAASLYREGRISKEEFSRVLAFSNHPSPTFLISTVGLSLFGSSRFGVLLYLTTLLSSLLLQILWGLPKKKNETSSASLAFHTRTPPLSPVSALAQAVSGSALSLLSICAFVVFFSALVECLTHLCAGISLSSSLTALIFGLFELTGGAAHAADAPAKVAPYLCAFSVGWAGLSVHFQLFHLVSDLDFSKKTYLCAKLAQGALNIPILALMMYVGETFGGAF